MSALTNFLSGQAGNLIKLAMPKKGKAELAPGEANAVTSIPVIYGRPGWVMAAPVIVGHQIHSSKVRYDYLEIMHVISEGVSRQPEAIKIDGRLAGYSTKYTQAEAEVIGGAVNSALIGKATIGFGWPEGFPVNEDLDSTTAQYSGANWPDSFNGLMVCTSVHYTEKTAQHYTGGIPTLEIMPNGVALHDPRIAYSLADSWVYRESGLSKSLVGGVAKGWQSTNGSSSRLNPSMHISDWGVSRFFPGEQDELPVQSNLGDSADNNNALVVLDYIIDGVYGAGIAVADVSMLHMVAMANYCDELAPTYSGGPNQQQMACNLVINTEDKLKDNLEKILATCRGLVGWVDGQYQLHIPRAGIPVAGELNTNILKRRSFSLGEKSKRLNRILATYIEPNKGYKENQLVYPAVDSTEDVLWRQNEDGGVLNEIEINLEGCTNAYQAADLCAVMIRESRASMTAEYEVNLSGLKYTLGDVLRVTDPDGAFTDKLFYVRKWEYDHSIRRVIIGISEYADAIYDVLAHPVLERSPGEVIGVDPRVIPNVTGLSFVATTYNKTVLGQLDWVAVNHSAITGYDVRAVGPSGSVDWAVFVDSGLASVNVPYLQTGEYSLEVRARSAVGVGNFTGLTVNHNTPSPVAITGLQVVGAWVGRDAQIEWIADDSAAFKRYRIEVRTVGGAVLYSEYATAPQFDFTYDKNIAAGLSRSHVIAIAVQYDDDSLSDYSEITINNAMPAAPTSIASSVLPNDLAISFDVANPDSDFVGASLEFHKAGEVWRRFDLDEHVRSYSLSDLDSSSNYEFRLVSRDVFGDGVYSSIIVVNTPAPISPADFDVDAGVNVVTLKITGQAGYVGCDVWVRNRNSVPGAALPSWSGADSSVTVSQLASATDYSVYYAPRDKKGVRGAIVHVPFTTVQLSAVDLSGLSPWATKTDPLDAAWITAQLEADAIPSTRIANLTAAKLTAGLITATIGIHSGGSIESSNTGYKAGLGVYEDTDGTIYTLMTASSSGDIKGGFTADGKLISKDADIQGRVTITGGSGYAQLSDKPSSLSDINATEVADIDTSIATAQANAAADATSKANAAKVAAENAAVITANAHADGIVSAEETRAIADAQAKANAAQAAATAAAQNFANTAQANAATHALTTTKTVIDGGLITTGSITLDPAAGSIQAGKTGFTTVGSGFWLGISGSPAKAGFIVGNTNEYLSFREDQGIRLTTPDLTIGAGGEAIFSGRITAGAGQFIVSKSGQTPAAAITGAPAYCINAITTINQDTAGQAIYATHGVGLWAASEHDIGASFKSIAARTSNKSVVELTSPNGVAHIKMNPLATAGSYGYIPYGKAGDMASVRRNNGFAYVLFCYQDYIVSGTHRGRWKHLGMESAWRQGGDAFNSNGR